MTKIRFVMNKKILFILVMWGMLFSSCTDWLDVTPENSIEEADLFKEATGCFEWCV